MFSFGCVFSLSRLAGRNINISNDSIKKMFWYVRFPERKNSGGKVCYVGNKITPNGFQHKIKAALQNTAVHSSDVQRK
jgi:hypothetical protein